MDGLAAPRDARTYEFKSAPAYMLLDDAVRRYGNRPALDFLGRRTDYAELGRLANRAAAGLQKIGVTRGTKVGLCLPNCPYSVIMYFAILKAGGTVVNFNPLYTEREIEAQARDTGLAIMVSLDIAAIQSKIERLVSKGVLKQVVICSMAAALPPVKSVLFRIFKRKELARTPRHSCYVPFSKLISGPELPKPVFIEPSQDIAVLQYTGGTTGTPKAAILTHDNVRVNVAQSVAAFPVVEKGAERILGILPLFHVFAMTSVMNYGISIGAEILLLPRLDLKVLMHTIHNRKPSILPGVPTVLTAICNAAESEENPDFSFIKFCISGGAPLAVEALARFERITKAQVLEGYGLSEASPVLTFNKPGAAKSGSVGPAFPGTIIEIRDRDDPTKLLPQGERGEICARGPQVMRGYYNRPEETAKVFVDGALRTGDVGYLDEDGYVFIVDRIKDLILCGGYNVYPRVIEEAAYQHPAVQDACAIGVPDEYRGQAPKLFVSLREGHSATGLEILEFLKGHLNKIEIPKSVEIRDSLPKTSVGKLSKKELVAEEAEKHGG